MPSADKAPLTVDASEIINYVKRLVENGSSHSQTSSNVQAPVVHELSAGEPVAATRSTTSTAVSAHSNDNEAVNATEEGDHAPGPLYRTITGKAIAVWNLAYDLYKKGSGVTSAPLSFAELLQDLKDLKRFLWTIQAQLTLKQVREDFWTGRVLQKAKDALLSLEPLVAKYQEQKRADKEQSTWKNRVSSIPDRSQLLRCGGGTSRESSGCFVFSSVQMV